MLAGLKSFDDIGELLPEQGPDEAVPGVSQDDDHHPDQPFPPAVGIPYVPQSPEVHLRYFTRPGVCQPDGVAAIFTPASPCDETAQRSISHITVMPEE